MYHVYKKHAMGRCQETITLEVGIRAILGMVGLTSDIRCLVILMLYWQRQILTFGCRKSS